MISQLANVAPSAKLGKNVEIMPFAFIDEDVEIGDNTVIYPYASIVRGTRIGANCKVYQGSIVGADPQDFRWKGERTFCHLGDNVIVREHVIINRSIYADQATFIGDDTFIMAKSHLGHDAHIAGKCVLGNGVVIAGNTHVGACSIMSSGAMLHEGCTIGEWVLIKGGCRIGSNVPPFTIFAHNPASYHGVNAVIMRRHDAFTEDEIDDAAKVYRHIYQSGTSVFNAMRRVAADVPEGRIRTAVETFVSSVNRRLVGIPRDLD